MSSPALSVGQTIELNDGRIAQVRFVGSTNFQTGEWVGVELEEATGKNDGSVKGDRYFVCEQGHGMFLRPSGVRQVLDQARSTERSDANVVPSRAATTTAAKGANGVKRQSLQPGTTKRQSMVGTNTASAARASGIRSQVKSPTKHLATNGISSTSNSRTRTPSVRENPATPGASRTAPRQSTVPMGGRGTSTLPSSAAVAATRQTRLSQTPLTSSSRTGPGRATTGNPPLPGSRHLGPGSRSGIRPRQGSATSSQANDDQAHDGPEHPTSKSITTNDIQIDGKRDGEDGESNALFAPLPVAYEPPDRNMRARRPSSPAAVSTHSSRTIRSGAASAKQIEELEAKVRLLERKRQEDRAVKNALERTQQERDKYQSIIEKLQTKYQPQQRENEELKRELAESEQRFAKFDAIQAEHDSVLEMATLDREMAEETAEALKADLEALRSRTEEMELELEVLREENSELGKEMSPEERTSAGWLQMEKSNERLRDALLRLRDVTQDQEAELREEIRGLESSIKDLEGFKIRYDEVKEKQLQSEADAEDLRQRLEAALGAEEMIEELTEQNMALHENIDELRATISDLEDLKELNDELEVNHVEAEKQMLDEIDFKESLLLDRDRTAKQQQEALDDADYTISRFRELVSTLQNDLQDMQASKQLSETESAELQTRSRAMMDLNIKLQSSAAKTQVKTIDLELRRLEAQEAIEHLDIVRLFLPESFDRERQSVHTLLRFKRISFKASVVHNFVKERIASPGVKGYAENAFVACHVLDELTWIMAMADRFSKAISSCTIDDFVGFEHALYELEPVERALNVYIDGLRRDELKEPSIAEELQRSIAVMTHLATIHFKNDLTSHADDLVMRITSLQSQLENTSTALGLIKDMTRASLPPLPPDEDEDDEDGSISDRALILNRADTLITHARNAKVIVQKTHRSLGELFDRSLTLELDCAESFANAETLVAKVNEYVRRVGETLCGLFGEEGRTEAFTPSEVENVLSRVAMSVFQLSAPDAGPFNSLATRLRDLSVRLTELAAIPTDLDNAVEFERLPAPWIARANELNQTKLTSINREAELGRMRETIRERDVVVHEKETELEEQSLRIEMLEARMKEAGKKSAKIAELERELYRAQDEQQKAKADFANAKRDAQHELVRMREEMSHMVEQRVRGSAGTHLQDDAMGAGARMTMKRQQHKITSLQGAVRYLAEQNRCSRLPSPDALQSHSSIVEWLHTPLVKSKSDTRKQQLLRHDEGTGVLHDLRRLAQRSQPIDLTTLPANRLAWRPSTKSSRWKIEKSKEEWESWKDWRGDVIREAARPLSSHVRYVTALSAPVATKVDIIPDKVKVADPEDLEVASNYESSTSS